jgi:hypothetical protein
VVVDDFDVFSSRILPAETDTPMIVNPYAELPSALASQYLQPIARWNSQVLQAHSDLELSKFPSRYGGNVGKSSNSIALRK